MLLLGIGILFGIKLQNLAHYKNIPKSLTSIGNKKVQQMLLTPNKYSRPQIPLKKVKSVVVHYTANPGTTGKANRNYFENLRIEKTTSASSHFVIGLDPDETGKFNDKTYDSLVALLSWICTEYRLKTDDIIRHYDVTGKLCPLYYVDNEDAWEKLKADVDDYMKR